MCILGKIFGQTCLKFSRDFFFNMRSVIRWGTGRINFMAKSICSRRRVQTFCLSGGSPTSILSIVGQPDLSIRKTLCRVLGLLTVMILKKWVRLFSFKATKLQHVKLKNMKRWLIFWRCSIYWRLSICSKVGSI